MPRSLSLPQAVRRRSTRWVFAPLLTGKNAVVFFGLQSLRAATADVSPSLRTGPLMVSTSWLLILALVGGGPTVRHSAAAEQLAPPRPVTPAEPQPFDDPAEELGYALGYRIGQRIIADHRELGTPLDATALGRGLADAVRDAPPQLDEAGFRRVLSVFEQRMEERNRQIEARMEAAGKANLAKGNDFLTKNATLPGVTRLPSGLQYEVLRQGSGPKPTSEDAVVAHYRGSHIDGTEFDGTDPEGEPATFPLRGVVPGWQEALPLMAVGSKWRLWLPPDLAYGEAGSPPAIEPNEVLVFEIDLIEVRPLRR
jgi:FKBP-type peptidyl-prolyl cis-trans isomerase FklB